MRNGQRPSHLVLGGAPDNPDEWIEILDWLKKCVYPIMNRQGATIQLTHIHRKYGMPIPNFLTILEDED